MLDNFKLKQRILICGVSGMLGQRCARYYSQLPGYEIMGAAPDETIKFPEVSYVYLDYTQREEVKKLVEDFCPDVIINAGAFTNVDKSETERETAWKINVKGVEHIAEAARIVDAHVVHISSDYVFDGKRGPYSEVDAPCPINYYGRTKLASENALHISGARYSILRTNVLYGIIPNGRLDFVRWVVDSISQEKQINIVTDQYNNPTFIDDLVRAMGTVVDKEAYGVYHVAGMEVLSRYDFTMRILQAFDLPSDRVVPILTESLNQPAQRPLKSGLLILKAQSELGYSPMNLDDSLELMRRELS